MVRQYSVCSKAHTECLQPCSVLKTTAERKVCFADCGNVKGVCTDQATADYKACVAALGQAQEKQEESPKSLGESKSTGQSESQEAWKIWYEAMQKVNEEYEKAYDKAFEARLKQIREENMAEMGEIIDPKLSEEEIKQSPQWEKAHGKTDAPLYSVFQKNEGSTKIKLPGTTEFITLTPDQKIPPGSVIQASEPVFIAIRNKGVFELRPGFLGPGEVELSDMGVSEAMNSIQLEMFMDLRNGEVEGFVEEAEKINQEFPGGGGIFEINTSDGSVVIVGTHLLVKYDKKKGTEVAVYKGEVEVKTKDGESIKVASQNGKPGLATITRQLSITKLAIFGLVLAGIAGGIILFLKKR